MAASYTIECRNSVIEVRVAGTPDRPSIAQMWKDIVAACAEALLEIINRAGRAKERQQDEERRSNAA